jgi:hypothetical protein
VFTLATTGTYTITVDPRLFTGSLTFLMAPVPDSTGTTAIGTSTTVSTTVIGRTRGRSRYGGSEVDVDVVEQHLPAGGCDGARPNGVVASVFASTADLP